MSYTISITKQAFKELELLSKKINQRISAAIDKLSQTPYPIGSKKLRGKKRLFGELGLLIIGFFIP